MRIPKRAILRKEKHGVNDVGLTCSIQIWEDWKDRDKRMFFKATREGWKRPFIKIFTGKNLGQENEWWKKNEFTIK